MITLSGAHGRGALWGTFYLPDREISGKAVCDFSHLDYAIPPSEWVLPPPNSVWYPTGEGCMYGPILSTLRVGSIESVSSSNDDWNPCKHSTIRGDALYYGSDGLSSPYFRIWNHTPATVFTACDASKVTPKLLNRRLTVMSGTPCTTSDTKVRSYTGSLVTASLTSSNDGSRYYGYATTLCGNIVSNPSIRSVLTSAGVPYANGQWYCRQGSNNNIVTDPCGSTQWAKTFWDRQDRTTFVRDQVVSYNTYLSNTPSSSVGSNGYGNLFDEEHRITTCTITGVRSDAAGRFQVRYDHTTYLRWFGISLGIPFSGQKQVTTKGLIAAVLILEPGLTPEVDVDVSAANNYCKLAIDRARLLYDPRTAAGARTNAVRDVQALDSNWLENLAGVKGTMDCVLPLIEGYRAVRSGDLALARKALASGYLTYQYVIKPGVSDVINVDEDADRLIDLATKYRFSDERRRGMSINVDIPLLGTKATISYFTTLHLRLKNNFSQIWAALERLKIDPSAGQIWDLIPFSFVVDWFVPVGNTLRNIDQYNSLVLTRNLLKRIESFKVQWPLEEQSISGLFGKSICSNGSPLEYSWYDRRLFDDIGSIDTVSINSDNNGLSLSQMTQGTALLTHMR